VLKNDSNYRRLRVGGRHLGGTTSYWIGPNHLLVVEVSNYVERYRRFYFRDVQTILVQDSPVRLGWNIGFGILAGLALLGVLASAISASQGEVVVAIWFAFFLLFAGCLVINTRRGPSCSVQLRTAVQNQKLPGIRRWRKAEAFVAGITPFINAAQSLPGGTPPPPTASAAGSPESLAVDPDVPPRIIP